LPNKFWSKPMLRPRPFRFSGKNGPDKRRFAPINWLAVNGAPPGSGYLALFGLWLLGLIALPIARFIWADSGAIVAISISVIFQAALVLTILRQAWGTRRAAATAVTVIALTWAVEFIGSSTGFPFGRYSYTAALQPQLGHVPLLIPLAWLMMLPPAWAVAWLANGRRTGWRFVLLSALALTAWDLFIDPQMVGWGYWEWHRPGLYFGIPLINFFGWALSGAIITAVVNPKNLPIHPLLLIYVVTWILQTLGQLFFWQMPGPALSGFVGMGLFIALAWRAER
jgi:putative membrane protein